jgi:hypothetical protein
MYHSGTRPNPHLLAIVPSRPLAWRKSRWRSIHATHPERRQRWQGRHGEESQVGDRHRTLESPQDGQEGAEVSDLWQEIQQVVRATSFVAWWPRKSGSGARFFNVLSTGCAPPSATKRPLLVVEATTTLLRVGIFGSDRCFHVPLWERGWPRRFSRF